MTIGTSRFGRPKVVNSRLTADQEDLFLQVRLQLPGGISRDPLLRIQQMGGLAPHADIKLAKDLHSFAVAKIARDLLDSSNIKFENGKRAVGGELYQITESSNSLAITAPGRGKILLQRGGVIRAKLNTTDVSHFLYLGRDLARLQTHEQITATQSLQPKGISVG